ACLSGSAKSPRLDRRTCAFGPPHAASAQIAPYGLEKPSPAVDRLGLTLAQMGSQCVVQNVLHGVWLGESICSVMEPIPQLRGNFPRSVVMRSCEGIVDAGQVELVGNLHGADSQ